MHISNTTKSTARLISDWEAFRGLPAKAQADVLMKLDGINEFYNATKGGETKADIVSRIANQRGISTSTFYKELSAFETRNEKALIDRRKFPKSSGLPDPFKKYIKGLFDQHQRMDCLLYTSPSPRDRG